MSHPCPPCTSPRILSGTTQGTVRSTTRYWVRMCDVSTVKHHILQVWCGGREGIPVRVVRVSIRACERALRLCATGATARLPSPPPSPTSPPLFPSALPTALRSTCPSSSTTRVRGTPATRSWSTRVGAGPLAAFCSDFFSCSFFLCRRRVASADGLLRVACSPLRPLLHSAPHRH